MENRVNVLGVGVSPVNIPAVVEVLDGWIRHQERHYVCVTGVHGVMESQTDPKLREVYNRAGLSVPDGMPLVYLSRMLGQPQVDRVYGPDLMLEMCRVSTERGYRHYLYGTTEATLVKLRARLERDYPGIQICGSYSPPFRALSEQEMQDVHTRINDANPDIVWVSLGAPKQEMWMANNRPYLNAPVLVGVGAAFDFHAGNTPQAPHWMQRACLEWAYRLSKEPKRLWRRYVYHNPRFLYCLSLQLLGLRKYELAQSR